MHIASIISSSSHLKSNHLTCSCQVLSGFFTLILFAGFGYYFFTRSGGDDDGGDSGKQPAQGEDLNDPLAEARRIM